MEKFKDLQISLKFGGTVVQHGGGGEKIFSFSLCIGFFVKYFTTFLLLHFATFFALVYLLTYHNVDTDCVKEMWVDFAKQFFSKIVLSQWRVAVQKASS